MSAQTVIVFAPTRPGDEALVRTRWIADCTLAMLQGENITPVALLDGHATRARLEAAATDAVHGLAMLSHGRDSHIGSSGSRAGRARRDDAILGADGDPALHRDNLHVTRARWVHAIACYAGVELGAQAVHAGAACFVGYDCALLVDWEPAALPPAIEPLVRELVIITTRNLARGVRDPRALKRHAEAIAEEISAWCMEHGDAAEGIEATAHQLVDRMQLFVPAAP
jgi:hypothetical protein